jgi:UDP-N-acetyl-2-amino-2-deoxyglucuronate dehydrogenase
METGFAIVGCGMIAGFHARALAGIPGVKLVACTSRRPELRERFATEHRCLAFETIDQVLRHPEVHAISLCTPGGCHLEDVLKAAAAGRHVIVEKPLEVTADRCREMVQACDRANVRLATVFQARFHPESQRLKRAVESGRFGQLALASAQVKWFRTQEYYDSADWRGTWRLDGGGALMNQAIHNVDLLLWIAGPVTSVSARSALRAHSGIEVEDTLVACLEFANGALGTIEATTASWPGWKKRLEICGSLGSAVLEDEYLVKWEFATPFAEDQPATANLLEEHGRSGGATDPAAITHYAHQLQLKDFVDAIQQGRTPLVDGREGTRSVALINAIYQSIREDRSIRPGGN